MPMQHWVISGIGLVAVAQAAIAQPGSASPSAGNPMKGESFVSLDADSDGVLSRVELTSIPDVQMQFETMDTDKDGTLSALEFSSSMNTTGVTGGPRMPGATRTFEQGSSPQPTTRR